VCHLDDDDDDDHYNYDPTGKIQKPDDPAQAAALKEQIVHPTPPSEVSLLGTRSNKHHKKHHKGSAGSVQPN